MRDIKKVYSLIHWLEAVAKDIKENKAELVHLKSMDKMYDILIGECDEYILFPWPDYQEYMEEEWFRDECYYCADKDVYFIPKERIES